MRSLIGLAFSVSQVVLLDSSIQLEVAPMRLPKA